MKKNETIDRILRAAKAEISSSGIDSAKIENIAREAGVTKQLIYHYFKTKDHLYSATLEAVSQDIGILANIDDYRKLAPDAAIERVIDKLIDEFIANPSYAALTLDQALHGGKHVTASSLYIPTIQRFIAKVLSPILARGADSGVLRPGLDPAITFWVIFNVATSCFLNEKAMSDSTGVDFSTAEGVETWRRTARDFTLRALRP